MGDWLATAGSRPEHGALFLDFDGTLAPIVADPAQASPHAEVPSLLRRLARRWGLVAVVSGRPVSYLRGRLQDAGRTRLLGLYGLEAIEPAVAGQPQPEVRTSPEAERWREAVGDAAAAARVAVPTGVSVEHKGLTVTLHYRADPGRRSWVEAFASEVAGRSGLAAHDGKMSVELRPPVEVDKGTVLLDLAAPYGAVLFAGDDRGDLPAFEALRAMRRSGKATLSVASGGPETPEEITSAADVVVDGPAGVVALLKRLEA